jgi:hypothetical protein
LFWRKKKEQIIYGCEPKLVCRVYRCNWSAYYIAKRWNADGLLSDEGLKAVLEEGKTD